MNVYQLSLVVASDSALSNIYALGWQLKGNGEALKEVFRKDIPRRKQYDSTASVRCVHGHDKLSTGLDSLCSFCMNCLTELISLIQTIFTCHFEM